MLQKHRLLKSRWRTNIPIYFLPIYVLYVLAFNKPRPESHAYLYVIKWCVYGFRAVVNLLVSSSELCFDAADHLSLFTFGPVRGATA